MKYLIFFLLSTQVFAYKKGYALKAGATLSHYSIRSQSNTQSSMNGGFNTHFGYRRSSFEFNISSYVYFGKMKDYTLFGDVSNFTFFTDNQEIQTSGEIRNVIFSPNLKYLTNLKVGDVWHFYFGLGPMWSLTSFKLQPYTDKNNVIRSNHKVTFTSFGAIAIFGFEEILELKSQKPVFLELVYTFAQTRKVRIVDTSDKTAVQEISVEDTYFNILGHTLMLNFGMTVF